MIPSLNSSPAMFVQSLKEKGFSYIMKQTLATVFSHLIFRWRVELEAQCWFSCLIVDLNLKMSYELIFQPGL